MLWPPHTRISYLQHLSFIPPFQQAPQSGFKPVFESGWTGADHGYVHMGSKVVVVKVCRELSVTSWNLLSFRHIPCTIDPSLNVKVAQIRYCTLSLPSKETYHSHVCYLSDNFLRVAICLIISTSHFLVLLEDCYCRRRVG